MLFRFFLFRAYPLEASPLLTFFSCSVRGPPVFARNAGLCPYVDFRNTRSDLGERAAPGVLYYTPFLTSVATRVGLSWHFVGFHGFSWLSCFFFLDGLSRFLYFVYSGFSWVGTSRFGGISVAIIQTEPRVRLVGYTRTLEVPGDRPDKLGC